MKTIQLKGILWILGLLLSASDITGQRVIIDHPSAIGYPVIDLSELSPLGCVLTITDAAARRAQMHAQTPSNLETLEIGLSTSGHNGTWNTKMASRYQVMCANYPVDSTDWANAYIVCKQYSGEGGVAGQWRLPTERELMVIWGLHPQLLKRGSFKTFNADDYWCCTEYTLIDKSWFVGFYNGMINVSLKTAKHKVRCVRDI